MSLKSSYNEYHTQLGETGHGLVVSDKEHEISDGTEIANVYDAIKLKFPWYKWMHALMDTSPVVSHAAVVNSSSVPDLSVFGGNVDHGHLGEDNEETFFPWPSSPVPNSHQGSPGLERSSDLGESDGTPINTPVKFKIPAKPLTVSKPTSTRKKTAADLAWEVAEAECHVHFQMAHINAKEKTTCEQIKQRSAQKTALEIEELHLRHQQEEGVSAST
ncbi:hypothetical protein V8B97DRAFT_2002283 [Scleroderma yunnanense]